MKIPCYNSLVNFSKFTFPLICLLLVAAFFWWFLTPSSLPPGEGVGTLSREHIKDSDPDPQYNSNPPTSGPHGEVWTPAGFYESERNDRNLVHSLEHGYVVISYNCAIGEEKSENRYQNSSVVWAHEAGKKMSSESGQLEATSSATLGNESCHKLKDQLKDLVKEYKQWKIIAVPRSNLEVRIALTAWGRIDKFNGLDKSRIERFIKAFRDKGPEATKD